MCMLSVWACRCLMLSQVVAKGLSVVLQWTSTRTDVTANAPWLYLFNCTARQKSCSIGNVTSDLKTQTAGKSIITLHETGKAQRPCCVFVFWNLWLHLLLLAVWRSLLVSTPSLHSKQQGSRKSTVRIWARSVPMYKYGGLRFSNEKMNRMLWLRHSSMSDICVELRSWGMCLLSVEDVEHALNC